MGKNEEFPSSIFKTYWRSIFYKNFYRPNVLRKIIFGNTLALITENWEEYWGDIPSQYKNCMLIFKKSWQEYLTKNFDIKSAKKYIEAYFHILSTVIAVKFRNQKENNFLSRLISFENVLLTFDEFSYPFAALTINRRNPIFLSLLFSKNRLDERNDPSLLPLIVGFDNHNAFLFYHYRKQRFIKNSNENLLFFLSLDKQNRQNSFCGLDSLTEIFADTWDSRIDQRSKMIVDKVLIPLIKVAFNKDIRSIRILDIGSGDCKFTDSILSRLIKSGILAKRKIEISLLDFISNDKTIVFDNKNYTEKLAKVEIISSDYKVWTEKNKNTCQFDIVFLFRILHNLSNFKIQSEDFLENKENLNKGRYRIFPNLSDYYKGISCLFNIENENNNSNKSNVFYPERIFDNKCLILQDGFSLIENLIFISKIIIIEDGDLTRDILISHISQHISISIFVYDLSKYLRLKLNHIYLISGKELNNIIGEKIWPLSKN